LSKKILFERIKDSNIMAIIENDEIVFNVTNKVTAKLNDQGIIEVSSEHNSD
jgi:hypothetical protein